jgi:hypothetical protein
LDAARYVPLGEKRSSETRASASGIAQPTGAAANDIGADDRQAAGDQIIATRRLGAAGETCGLNSGNLNILSEARIHASELISDQVSVDPIEEVLCPSLVSREVRRWCVIPPDDCFVELVPKGDAIHDLGSSQLDFLNPW